MAGDNGGTFILWRVGLHPLLIDLAAGRHVAGGVDQALVTTAVDHRVAGLLWTQVSAGQLEATQPVREYLESLDLQAWGRARMLEAALDELLTASERLGVRLALIKGLAAAARWYQRPTERWAYDLDVVVHPGDLGAVDELMSVVYPSHPLRGHLVDLMRRRHIQSVDFGVRDMPVDMHLDPFKLEIMWARSPERLWRHMEDLPIASGLVVPTFNNEVSVLVHLMHLNKDSFRRLAGYADVARGMSQDLDWDVINSLAFHEGMETALMQTVAAVAKDLRIATETTPHRGGLRASLWRRAWPEEGRLQLTSAGGRRHRLFVIPLLARGRLVEALRGWIRRLLPPGALLDYYYPTSHDIYFVKLVRERLRRRLSRGAERG